MGGKQFSTQIFSSWRKYLKSLFLTTVKKITSIFQKSVDIVIQSEKIFFSNLTVPLWGPSEGTVFHTIFTGKDILRKTTSAIRHSKNQSHNPGILTPRGCGLWKLRVAPKSQFASHCVCNQDVLPLSPESKIRLFAYTLNNRFKYIL